MSVVQVPCGLENADNCNYFISFALDKHTILKGGKCKSVLQPTLCNIFMQQNSVGKKFNACLILYRLITNPLVRTSESLVKRCQHLWQIRQKAMSTLSCSQEIIRIQHWLQEQQCTITMLRKETTELCSGYMTKWAKLKLKISML